MGDSGDRGRLSQHLVTARLATGAGLFSVARNHPDQRNVGDGVAEVSEGARSLRPVHVWRPTAEHDQVDAAGPGQVERTAAVTGGQNDVAELLENGAQRMAAARDPVLRSEP